MRGHLRMPIPLTRRLRLLLCLVASCTTAAPAIAQITVSASLRPQRVQVGDSLILLISINGAQNVSAPPLPELKGFEARYVGPSTQISFVNGRMSAAVEHRYSLLALQPGRFTVGPFTVQYEGKDYPTQSFTVEVAANAQAQPSGGGKAPGQQAAGTSALRLALSAQEQVYVHQRVPIEIALYVGPIRVSDVQYPTLRGDAFSIEKPPEPTQRQEDIDGTTYQVVRFQTSVIPLRSGTHTLGPASLRLNVVERRRGGTFDDPFFDPFMGSRRLTELRSDAATITVLPLPEESKPANFSGAVGTFTMQVTASPTEVGAGDPITLRVDIRGVGNLADISPPAMSRSEGFRVYDAHSTKTEAQGVETSRSFEQVILPNTETAQQIPSLSFSYFDPRARRYETVESQPIALVVRPSEGNGRTEIVAGSRPQVPALPEPVGRDIVFIKDDPGPLTSRTTSWGMRALLLWQPVPLCMFLAAAYYDQRRRRLTGDVRYARFTRAGKEAARGLSGAEQALTTGDRQAFYDTISHAMQAYLGAKLDLPPGSIDADSMAQRSIPAECRNRIQQFFETCERIRFAPAAGDGDMRGTLDLARDIVKQLERERFTTAPGVPS